MKSATTVGNTVKISSPTYDWEKVGANVNEGAAMLYNGARVFLVYSASNCAGTGYKLGRLELTGSDPLNASSWTKYSKPIFESANGSVFPFLKWHNHSADLLVKRRNYQPGHNGFFTSPSNNQVYQVVHANPTTPGTCDGNRYSMVQPVYFHSDGVLLSWFNCFFLC